MAFGLAIRAPWKGRVGLIGMPIVSTLITANTLAIFVLTIFNASAVELHGNTDDIVRDRAYVSHVSHLKRNAGTDLSDSILGLFWCTVPFVFGIVTVSEIFCLWTDRLAPIWVLFSSSMAICLWAVEMVLWQYCVNGTDSVPGYCPHIYQVSGQVPFFDWYNASASAPVAAIPTLIILYVRTTSLVTILANTCVDTWCNYPSLASLSTDNADTPSEDLT